MAAAKPSASKSASEPASAKHGKLRWVLGWIVVPGTLIAALFLAGVHVGARRPDGGLARMMLKVFGGKPGVASEPEQRAPDKPRPGAKPGEPFSLSTVLQPKQLEAIAEKSLGLSVEDLDCEHVCRVYFKSEYETAIYSIEQCQLSRAVSHVPSFLSCSGTLEAIEAIGPARNGSGPHAQPPASNDGASQAAQNGR